MRMSGRNILQQQQQRRRQQSLKDWLISSSSLTTTTTINDAYSRSSIQKNILLLDGGVSTHLENLMKPKDPSKQSPGFPIRSLWSSSLLMTPHGRQTIFQGHKDWLKAGSDIITTVTYQCHFGTVVRNNDTDNVVVKKVVPDQEMKTMISDGIRLAGQAIVADDEEEDEDFQEDKNNKYVVASSGCYGAALADGSEYTGNYGKDISLKDLEEFHKRKIETFLLAEQSNNRYKLDGIAIETIPSLLEVEAVCNVILDVSKKKIKSQDSNTIAYWISLACQNASELNEGVPIQNALEVIKQKDPYCEYIHGIGINCCDSKHIDGLVEIITQNMAKTTHIEGGGRPFSRRGIIIYPNSGEEWDATTESWKEGTGCINNDSTEFTERLKHAIDIIQTTWKANNHHSPSSSPPPKLVIGGCCRTTPSEIRALRKWIDENQ